MGLKDTDNEGVRWEKRSVRPYEGGQSYKFDVGINLAGITRRDLEKVAFGAFWIRFQDKLRELGDEGLAEIEKKGRITVHWSECGMKIITDDARRDEMVKQIMLMTKCSEAAAKAKLLRMLEEENK